MSNIHCHLRFHYRKFNPIKAVRKLCKNVPKIEIYFLFPIYFFGGFSAVNEIKRLEKDLISTHGSHNCQSNVPNPWPELISLVVSHHVEIHKVHPK